MDNLSIKIERTSNSLFESGKIVSKATTWLLVISSALILIACIVKPSEPILIPIAGLKLEKYHAIGVFFLIYTVALLRYVISVNYQKYLFWELSTLLGSKKIVEKPWQYIYPGTMNYLLYNGYIHNGHTQELNFSLMVFYSFILAFIPLPIIILLFSEITNDYYLLTMFSAGMLFYLAAFKNMRDHTKMESEYKKTNRL